MATMSAARIRSLCRRHNQAHEAVYHFSANPGQHGVTGFSAARATETSPSLPPRSASNLKTEVLIAEGRPATKILEVARKHSADLIAIGVRGTGGSRE